MAVPTTIALYASPPSSVCSTTHQINAHASCDFELNSRPSSSATSTASSSQKTIVGGLSCLFSSSSVKHASSSSSSFSGGGEDLGSLWHDRGEEMKELSLSSSFRYSPSKFGGGSYLKRDQSPVSVLQGPFSCSSNGGVGSARSPPMRISRDKNFDISFRGNANVLFNGFIRNALGSCVDYDSPSSEADSDGSIDKGSSSSVIVDELTFNMEDSFVGGNVEPRAKELLLGAQMRHKIFFDDFVIKAFHEAEKAHRGQVRLNMDLHYVF